MDVIFKVSNDTNGIKNLSEYCKSSVGKPYTYDGEKIGSIISVDIRKDGIYALVSIDPEKLPPFDLID